MAMLILRLLYHAECLVAARLPVIGQMGFPLTATLHQLQREASDGDTELKETPGQKRTSGERAWRQ